MNYFNKFNKLKVKYKDKVIPVLPLFVAVLGLLMVTIGGSYAYLTHVEEAELVNTITAGTLELTFSSDDSNINLINAVPQADSVALSENDAYEFNIKNVGNVSSYYEMRLEDVCSVGDSVSDIEIDQCIPLEFVRVAIKKGDEDYVIRHMDGDNSALLDSNILNGGADSDLYSLKIWLDVNTPNIYNDASKNIVFSAKLSLYAEQRYVQKVSSECFAIENNKIVDYTCNYSDIEIDSDLFNNVSQTSNNKIYRPKRLDNVNNYNEVDFVGDVVVDTIATDAFKSKGLRSVIINSNITTIEDNAFLDNPNLKDVVVGAVNFFADSFTTGGEIISMKDLAGDFPKACFTINSGVLDRYNCKDAVNVVLTEDITRINSNVFQNLGIKSVDFSKAVNLSDIQTYAFDGNKIRTLDFSNNPNLLYFRNYSFQNNLIRNVIFPKGSSLYLYHYVFLNNQFTSITLPSNLVYLGMSCFSNNKLEFVDLGMSNGLTNIQSSAFSNNFITDVKFSDSITLIANNAFKNNKITKLKLPISLQEIGASVFENNDIVGVNFSELNNLTTIGKGAFVGNEIKEIVFAEGLQTLGYNAFSGNGLTKLYLPDSLLSIDSYVFNNNKIKEVRFGNNLTSIGSNAFSVNLIEEVILPDSITSVGSTAFNRNKIKKVVIPLGVTNISDYAFNNNLIEEVIFHEEVSSMGIFAFANNKLTSVVIPNSVISIGNGAFYNNIVSELDLGDSVESIGENAFYSNNLSEVVIPSSVTAIRKSAFMKNSSSNSKLNKIVNLTGRAFDWYNVCVGTTEEPFVYGTMSYIATVVEITNS